MNSIIEIICYSKINAPLHHTDAVVTKNRIYVWILPDVLMCVTLDISVCSYYISTKTNIYIYIFTVASLVNYKTKKYIIVCCCSCSLSRDSSKNNNII